MRVKMKIGTKIVHMGRPYKVKLPDGSLQSVFPMSETCLITGKTLREWKAKGGLIYRP